VNRIVGAFGSTGALPRILRIQLGQRHRRYSLSRAQTHVFCTLSRSGRCEVRHTMPGLLREGDDRQVDIVASASRQKWRHGG
jgi:hypothetical protein